MKKSIFIASVVATSLAVYFLTSLKQSADNALTPGPVPQISQTTTRDIDDPEYLLTQLQNDQPITTTDFGISETGKNVTVLYIDNKRAQKVKGRKGTQLFLPANIFVKQDGTLPKGKIKIELVECYDVPDMLMSKLSTTSGNKLLETAGMIKLKAYSGKEELALSEGARYNIYFPKNKNTKEDFHLFYGDFNQDEIIDWKLADIETPIAETEGVIKTEEFISDPELIYNEGFGFSDSDENLNPRASWLSDDETCFINIAESNLRQGSSIMETDFFNWQLKNGQTMNQWFVANFNPDLKMLEEFCILGYRPVIHFKLEPEGKFSSYYIAKSSREDYDRLLARTIMSMPALDISKMQHPYSSNNACILTFASKQGTEQQAFVATFKKNIKTNEDGTIAKADNAGLDYFVYSSSELGWINCDRFADEDGQLVTVKVETNSPRCAVSMVFEDINSILKGVYEDGKMVFTNVPVNKKIRLIGLNTDQESPVMAIAQSQTAETTIPLKNYKPFTLEQLQAQFARNTTAL